MKTYFGVLILVLLSITLPNAAKADIAPPTYWTTLYFQQPNGKPVSQPVKFTIKCYGTGVFDESNQVLKISEFSGVSQKYGAAFGSFELFEVYRTNTKYCDLSGEADGKQFKVQKFIGSELEGLTCNRADFDMYNGRYFKDGVDVTDKLIKDENGHVYDELCEATIKLPFAVSTNVNIQPEEQTPTTTISSTTLQQQSVSSDTKQPGGASTVQEPVKAKGFFARLFGSVGCFFKKIFRKSC